MYPFLFRFLISALVIFPALGAVPQGIAPKLPMVFEPNAGRFDPQVKFTARADNYRVLLTAAGAELSGERTVSMSLLNSNPKAEIFGNDAIACRTSYFLGNRKQNWRTGIPNYARVRYAGVYPGIDLVYYSAGRELEYDFVVGAGADPNRIRVRFEGVDHMSVSPEGDLMVETGGVTLIEHRPAVYQQLPGSARRQIPGKFTLLGKNVVGFEVASYDPSRTLTIDPVLTYGTMLGSSGLDSVAGVKVDANGIIYVAGYLSNADFPSGASAYQSVVTGSPNLFIAEIDPKASGPNSLLYFTYIGGSGSDMANDMAIDGSGNVYVTGTTTSVDFPTTSNAPQPGLAGGASTDAFVLKFFPNTTDGIGALFFSTYLGGSGLDIAYGIGVDQKGLVYVTGTTQSTDYPVTPTAYQTILYGDSDTFLAQIDPVGGAILYSSYMGGESIDQARAIVVAPDGFVYTAGDTNSTMFPQEGNSYQPTFLGGGDMFLAKWDLTKSGEASVPYTTYLGGSKLDAARSMALDPTGKLLLTGYTLSPDFMITPDALNLDLTGIASIFIMRINLAAPNGNIIDYSTYYGGSGGDVAYGITSDAGANIYLTGYTLSTDFPVTLDALQATVGGGIDSFVSELNLGGANQKGLIYSTYAGQDGVNVGYAIAVSPKAGIVVGGQTGTGNIPETPSGVQNYFFGGLSDGFLLVLGQ